MFEIKYTEEQLNKCGLNFLRNYAREIGGTPGLMNKGELVGYILDIQSGKISPKRKKSGRKPLDLKGVNYGILGLANINNDEDVLSENFDSGFTKGYFETLSDGIGALMAGEEILVFVPSALASNYGLKTGDMVVGEWEKGRNKSRVLTTVKEINGRLPADILLRGNFDLEPALYPEARISFDKMGVAGKEIDLFAPVGRGQRCVVLYKKGLDEISLIEKIEAVCKDSGVYPVVSYVNCRPEDGQYLKGVCEEAIWTSFEKGLKEHKNAMQTAIIRAKRMAEIGEHSAIIAGSLSAAQSAFGGDPSEMMKPMFSIAKNTLKTKSVTLFALTDDESMAEKFEPYCNCLIVLDGDKIDLKRSYTRRKNALLSERELRAAEKACGSAECSAIESAAKKAKGAEEFISALEML